MHTELERVKDDDEAVKRHGVHACATLARSILNFQASTVDRGPRALHFISLNVIAEIARTLAVLNLLPGPTVRDAPWIPRALEEHGAMQDSDNEDAAASLALGGKRRSLALGDDGDAFPNGRWTSSRSPASGDLLDYYLAARRPRADRRKMWGVPSSAADISNVFVRFLDRAVPSLPWCDSPPALETEALRDSLKWMCSHGFWTIASQPRVNGAPSRDPVHGWGGGHGVVFQKAYIEAFMPREQFAALLPLLQQRGSRFTVVASDASGEQLATPPPPGVTAVTWGVFPGKEVLQPTVVDVSTFSAWRVEAFELWRSEWQSIYDETSEADAIARRVIQDCHDGCVLVCIVDNEYVKPDVDIFEPFRELVSLTLDEAGLRRRTQELEKEVAMLSAQLRLERSLREGAERALRRPGPASRGSTLAAAP